MNTTVFEIRCLLCGEVVACTLNPRPPAGRCPRCGGCLQNEPVLGDPREFGLAIRQEPGRCEREEPPQPGRCVSCRAPVQRAERCRRCYLRHRYATCPEVRAKQLSLQAAWRQRQMGKRQEVAG